MKSILLPSLLILLTLTLSTPTEARIEVQGHRGARARFPENTLPAFDYALKLGVDYLELDLVVSKDGQLVISHEAVMNPEICLDPQGKKISTEVALYKLNYAEIKKYDCGSLKHPRFPEQTPIPHTPKPLLKDLFDLIVRSKLPHAKNIKFNIETKIDPEHPELTPSPEEFTKLTIDMIKKYRFEKRSLIQSFDFRTIIISKKIAPQIKTVALVEDPKLDMLKAIDSTKADVISPYFLLLTGILVEEIHKKNVQVVPWTVNTEADWKKIVEMNVDGIITDDPEQLLKWLSLKR